MTEVAPDYHVSDLTLKDTFCRPVSKTTKNIASVLTFGLPHVIDVCNEVSKEIERESHHSGGGLDNHIKSFVLNSIMVTQVSASVATYTLMSYGIYNLFN